MRNGNQRTKWMPVEVEPFLSSAAVMAMKDFQRWWYMSLLLRAWQNVARPCHLENDAERLWMLAGAASKEFFAKHSAIVMAQFVEIDNGQWLANVKQLEVYANQLGKSDVRRDAGRAGGLATASKRAAKVQQCYSKPSLSVSSICSSSLKEPEDWISRIREIGKWRDGDSIAVEQSFFEQVAEKGVPPDRILEALARIYVATENGKFAPKLAEVIRRWDEPLDLWRREEKTSVRTGKFDRIFGEHEAPVG